MARIRTIKPEFFVDEELQDLEAANPGAYCMLVFAGLWGHCSKEGVFECRPRVLKLSILPFLDFSMADTLALLESAGFIRRFFVDEKEYGHIPSFEKHQRISGKEAMFSPKLPRPDKGSNGEAPGKHRGSTGENDDISKGQSGEESGIIEENDTVSASLDEPEPERKIPIKNSALPGEAPGKHRGSTGEAQEKEKEKEEDQNQSFIGGGTAKQSRDSPPQEAAEGVAVGETLEVEVERVKGLHLRTCGLNTLPPLAIVREILEQGKPVRLIDDVYQAHGGDIPKYRQRNIVEQLKALRDNRERSPPLGQKRRSAAEIRQAATFEAARAFAEGCHDGG